MTRHPTFDEPKYSAKTRERVGVRVSHGALPFVGTALGGRPCVPSPRAYLLPYELHM